jgi:hypothetical protein
VWDDTKMIDKEKFEAFEKVRTSSKINMAHHAQVVISAEGKLTIEDVKLIIAGYGDYEEEFGNE